MGIHRRSAVSNSYSLPSSCTAMCLLSSLENEMRSSLPNSAMSVGSDHTAAVGSVIVTSYRAACFVNASRRVW